jgi:hypothetical protein
MTYGPDDCDQHSGKHIIANPVAELVWINLLLLKAFAVIVGLPVYATIKQVFYILLLYL